VFVGRTCGRPCTCDAQGATNIAEADRAGPRHPRILPVSGYALESHLMLRVFAITSRVSAPSNKHSSWAASSSKIC
jgi:hypothetical protein